MGTISKEDLNAAVESLKESFKEDISCLNGKIHEVESKIGQLEAKQQPRGSSKK